MTAESRTGRPWHPYTQHATAAPPPLVESARGSFLHLADGRRIFDAISSWWVNLHGHAEPRIAAAISAQARRLEQVIFAGFTHEPAERLASRLVAVAPKGLERAFFSDDGSTAVEVAVKMALACRPAGERRSVIAALDCAYHGDTFGAMSVSARGPFTAPYARLLFDVERLPFPEADGGGTLEAFERLLKDSPGRVAALIVEPLVLGAGGMKMYGAAVLRGLRELCRRHGVLFIADEVMTGFGRTGTLFACDQAGVSPDIMCLSKGVTGGFLPLGVTLASAEVFAGFHSLDRGRAFFHGHSYTANPLACAAALANLDIFEQEPVFERIAAVARAHESGLKRLAGRPGIAAARRLGTIAAVEFDARDSGYLSDVGPRLYDFYLSRGVLLRPLGNVVYLMPPYCSTAEDIAAAYDAVEDSRALLAARP